MSNDASAREGQIGRYILEKELGRGGQGRVYLARDVELGREVALKVLAIGRTMSVQDRLRFKGEAEKAARVDHPNVARIYESGEDDGVPFIAMELVRGETLSAHIRRSARLAERRGEISELHLSFDDDSSGGSELEDASAVTAKSSAEPPLTTTANVDRQAIVEVAKLIESAARGLHEAHECGLVHRDIKPGNLVVAPGRGLVILDFGMALDLASDGPGLTMTGDVLGTPAYMSPEQLAAKRVGVDRRSDVYSLGVTLFECLALRRPFEAPSREALFQEIIAREAPDLRRLNRKVPADLAVIVQHALEKHPDQRYPSALELAEDLRRFREHEPVSARPVGPITRTWRWSQRKPATAALLATVFVALAAITVMTTLNSRRTSRLNETLGETNASLERATREAEARTREALANERRAQEEATARTAALKREREALAEKTAVLSEYERMADTRRLANARAQADAMWPVDPDIVPDLESWQVKYAPLFARLDDHRKALEALRAKAPACTDEERKRDFVVELARIAKLEEDLPKLRDQAKAEADEEKQEAREEAITKLEAELTALRGTVQGRRSWNFEDAVDLQFRHDTLAKLVADLDAFTAEEGGVVASIARRLDRSRRIGDETLKKHAGLWAETIARIASSPRYAGLTLAPQLGLIPLGPDPASGLEEFLDWRTHDWSADQGALPRRGEDGTIAMTETRGLIFVLIPGGPFRMGAQRDPEQANFDPASNPDESPVREVVLSAYLISKYEMTQGQWSRFDGVNPSNYEKGWFNAQVTKKAVDLRHPVEQVSRDECVRRLGRLGLQLPTEAQWERAARAGSEPATLWTGTSEPGDLVRFANIAGKETAAFYSTRSDIHQDDFVIHAPVGSFAANAFGLFDTTGNVWEWCRDAFTGYDVDPAPGDGLRRSPSRDGVCRGGSFFVPAVYARLAIRAAYDTTVRDGVLGLRPARRITNE